MDTVPIKAEQLPTSEQPTEPEQPAEGKAMPQQPAEPEPMYKDYVLAEDGDVLTLLNDQSRIRTSSIVLSLASPVFKKMLGPHFFEGQAPRSAEEPKQIALMDDAPYAMTMLLNATHFRSMVGPLGLTLKSIAQELAKMGLLADKYECVPALSTGAEALMLRRVNYLCVMEVDPTEAIRFLGLYSSAAYSLRLKKLFQYFTRRLVLDATTSFSTIGEVEACDVLPTSVILGLEEQRSALREYLIATIAARTSGKCQTPGCSRSSPSSTFVSEITRKLALPHWPPPWSSTSIRSILQKLYKPIEIPFGTVSPCVVDERACGLCLACARQDKSQSRCEHGEELKKAPLKDPIIQA
ncbi:hypothetical protein B0A55_07218 [Friedmanniomyces simplex]|uniref:BTB domain-containing protein n=1 Tax=Friedmanniomyces simplex TaxID=329884 RepID=A0A4U0XDG0_9PEZI|nr:hypothetical protein B0A55_07218 [Friedmanniomyces simplex]